MTQEDLQAIRAIMQEEVKPINERLDKVDKRLDKMETQINKVQKDIKELKRETKVTRQTTNFIGDWIQFHFDDKKYPVTKEDWEEKKKMEEFLREHA